MAGGDRVPGGAGRGRPAAIVCLLLAVSVVAVYHRVRGFAFVWDDQAFIGDNPLVRGGLSLAAIRGALTSFATGNWYPLTWISHMLDVQLFGLQPGPHHLVNLSLHALNSVLLFVVLHRFSGALRPSAFVAALFAVHPLHVESVAWVAERKDLLSALFWMLTMGAYARYAARPGPRRYAAVVLAFVLGLAAKPMVVTLPAVLLVLDWWPLGRLRPAAGWRGAAALLVEKLPLIALAAVGALVAYLAQGSVGAVASDAIYRPAWRVANALVTTAVYLGKAFWPAGLAAYYPFELGTRPLWQPGGALLLLAALAGTAFAARRRCPALATGLLWYLVTLLPVIGLVQVGGQARADRYMYLPLIGPGLAAAWCARALLRRLPRARPVLAAVAIVALSALAVAAARQCETWRNPLSLYSRMLEVTSGNWVAHNGYALELRNLGRLEEAIEHFRLAVALNYRPSYVRRNYAFALQDAGRDQEAMEQLRILVQMRPGDPEEHFRLGLLLGRAGRHAESLPHLREATRLRPWFPPGWDALGVSYANLGRRAEAEAAFREVLRIDPGNRNARANLERLRAP